MISFAALYCARVVDSILKFPLYELKAMPDNLQTDECISKLNERRNQNIHIKYYQSFKGNF